MSRALYLVFVLALFGIGLFEAVFKDDLADRVSGGALAVLSIAYLIELLAKERRG